MSVNTLGRKPKPESAREMAAVLASPEGEAYIARVLFAANAFGPSYVPGDPYATAYNEGLRTIGRLVLDDVMAADPGKMPALLTFQQTEEE